MLSCRYTGLLVGRLKRDIRKLLGVVNVFTVLILLMISLCINMPKLTELCILNVYSKLYVNYTCIKLLRIATSLAWTLQNKNRVGGRFGYGFFFFCNKFLVSRSSNKKSSFTFNYLLMSSLRAVHKCQPIEAPRNISMLGNFRSSKPLAQVISIIHHCEKEQ